MAEAQIYLRILDFTCECEHNVVVHGETKGYRCLGWKEIIGLTIFTQCECQEFIPKVEFIVLIDLKEPSSSWLK